MVRSSDFPTKAIRCRRNQPTNLPTPFASHSQPGDGMPNEQLAPGTRSLDRRDLLRFGGLACLRLDFAGSFRAETARGAQAPGQLPGTRLRSCILIFCNGGPSHLDTFDMKPDAPAEVRGEFRPIATSVPGV